MKTEQCAMTTDFFQMTSEGAINVLELTLPHTIDTAAFEHLNAGLSQLVIDRKAAPWVLDLSRVSYMGSSALGLMVNLRQLIKSTGGQLVLCGLSPRLEHIFHTCCLERLFTIVKTREDARRQLKHARG
jgi:anti-anti-sigma factor